MKALKIHKKGHKQKQIVSAEIVEQKYIHFSSQAAALDTQMTHFS